MMRVVWLFICRGVGAGLLAVGLIVTLARLQADGWTVLALVGLAVWVIAEIVTERDYWTP